MRFVFVTSLVIAGGRIESVNYPQFEAVPETRFSTGFRTIIQLFPPYANYSGKLIGFKI
jgi:hypothetical protein